MMKYLNDKSLERIAGGEEGEPTLLRIALFQPPANDTAGLTPPDEAMNGFVNVYKRFCHGGPGVYCIF